MLQGYRTYIMCGAMVLYNTLAAMGFDTVNSQEFANAINVILAVMAFIFRILAKPKEKQT